ncbi:putative mechanosensitive ion channel protein [Hamiltosporidium tvaerminnensis]|uniref:Putative mechanosensitive ion channel protein n=1 Tax=Hamiltosporidium tvaerminnensis TaxID=1176355 RepID=A0A4Q9LSU5_9MICR|nr:putative mechanosensitive ion channel protein [Hamiltosporidium tvaerminnensis]
MLKSLNYIKSLFSFKRNTETKIKENLIKTVPLTLSIISPRSMFTNDFFKKEFFANFFKSLYIFAFKPFGINDIVKVHGYEGKVDCLDWFYLRILKKDKSCVYIPTSSLYNSVIEIYQK